MALHSAIAWAAFTRSGNPAWLVAGMVYAMGKYLFVVGAHLGEALEPSMPGQVALEGILGQSRLGRDPASGDRVGACRCPLAPLDPPGGSGSA